MSIIDEHLPSYELLRFSPQLEIDDPLDMRGIITCTNSSEVAHTESALNNINDECLLQICKYLNLYHVRNLAASCRRLREFANTSLIPAIVRRLELVIIHEKQTVLHWDSCVVSVDSLRSQVRLFGNFVQHISINALVFDDSIWEIFGNILQMCPNLKTLRIENARCASVSELLSNVSPQLKELHWINSFYMTKDCSIVIKRLFELEKVTVTGGINTFMLFEHCKKLTYLNIKYDEESLLSVEDINTKGLTKILENNADTLVALKLTDFGYIYSDSIFQLISKKLTKLERLEITETKKISVPRAKNSSFDFSRIMVLNLNCTGRNIEINSLMQALSYFRVIEELTIFDGYFRNDNTDELTFEKLQKLCLYQRNVNTAFIKMITRARMPALQHLTITYHKQEVCYLKVFVDLIESKKSLTSLWVIGSSDFSLLVIKIIEMLKADLSGNRAFLKLSIPRKIGDQEVNYSVNI